MLWYKNYHVQFSGFRYGVDQNPRSDRICSVNCPSDPCVVHSRTSVSASRSPHEVEMEFSRLLCSEIPPIGNSSWTHLHLASVLLCRIRSASLHQNLRSHKLLQISSEYHVWLPSFQAALQFLLLHPSVNSLTAFPDAFLGIHFFFQETCHVISPKVIGYLVLSWLTRE